MRLPIVVLGPRTRAWLGALARGRAANAAREHGAGAAACALALAWFFRLGYGATLPPGRIEWLLRGDWAANFWGFCFFRNAPWSLPLGATPHLLWPFGTSLGFTDAVPWLALAFKPWSAWLPLDFQPYGLWLLLCFALQGWFGARLCAALTADPVQQALGGALFALTPVLPARNGHLALCALFFVTAGVGLCLRPLPSRRHAWRSFAGACGLLIWAAGTHGYLSAMLLALVLAYCVRAAWCERAVSSLELVLMAALALGVSVVTYWLFGYVGWKQVASAGGFGEFAADLSALVNPQRWSRWVRKLPFERRQAEGFAYLGCGVIALVVLRVGLWLRAPRASARAALRYWPLLAVVLPMAIYALSWDVRLLGKPVADLSEQYAPLATLTGVFRSSGRFMWPLHVALIAAAVSGCTALRIRALARVLLLAALALQASELKRKRLDFHAVELHRLRAPAWATLEHDYQHLELVPMQLKWVCRYEGDLINRTSYEAYRRKLTFNSGNAGRKEQALITRCRRKPKRTVAVDSHTVYVLHPAYRRFFVDAVCGWLDGLVVCASNQRETALLAAQRREPF